MSEGKAATSTIASSPKKLEKCKRFLTMLLSPSTSKRVPRRKKYARQNSKDIQSLKFIEKEREEISEDVFEHENVAVSPNVISKKSAHSTPCSSSFSPIQSIEPLYATVQKKVSRDISFEKDKNSNLNESKREITVSADVTPEPPQKKIEIHDSLTDSSSLSSHFARVKEHSTGKNTDVLKPVNASKTTSNLQNRIKIITAKNQELCRQVQSLKKETNWKKEAEHAKLRNEITKLETQTKNEVSLLCERIQALDEERKLLSDHVQRLHEEKKIQSKKYLEACSEKEKMVSLEKMTKLLDDQKKSLTNEKVEELKEINGLKLLNKKCINERNSLMIKLEILQSEMSALQHQNQELERQQLEILHDKELVIKQNEEFKRQEEEAQNIISSLLRVAENIEIERNVLLSKVAFHDHLHSEVQTTVIDYGLNIGRLQEHLLGIKRNFEDLEKTKNRIYNNDEVLKKTYEKQVDILRGKVLNQNNTIKELETEKSELKCHLDSLWKSAFHNEKSKDSFNKYLSFVNI